MWPFGAPRARDSCNPSLPMETLSLGLAFATVLGVIAAGIFLWRRRRRAAEKIAAREMPIPLVDFDPERLSVIAKLHPPFAERMATGEPISMIELEKYSALAWTAAQQGAITRGYDVVKYATFVMRIRAKDGSLDVEVEDENPERAKAQFGDRYHASNLDVVLVRPGRLRDA